MVISVDTLDSLPPVVTARPSRTSLVVELRIIGKNEVQRHCEEVYVDPAETIEE